MLFLGIFNSHELYKQVVFTSISTTTIYRAIHYGILKKERLQKNITFSIIYLIINFC